MSKNSISGRPTWPPKEKDLKNLCFEELDVLSVGWRLLLQGGLKNMI
jgi:hypothetical protein